MKILYLCSDTEFGGGQHYFLDFVDTFNNGEHEFFMGCRPYTKLANEINLPCIPFYVKSKTDVFEMIKFSKSIRSDNYNVIFLGDGAAWNTGIFLKCKNLIPIVHMTHIGLEEKKYGSVERFISGMWDRLWARYATKIVVSNEKNADILILEGVPRDKISVIKNCVDINKITNHDFIPREQLFDRTIIGTLSRLGPGKDVMTIIDSAKLLIEQNKNCHFIIVGSGPYRDKCEGYIKQLKLENYITLTGWVKNQYDYLNLFDIYLHSGISDGIPYGVLEAMAFGKPIVATNNGAVREAISYGRTGLLVEKKNPATMAWGISMLFDDQELKRKLGVNAKEVCREQFDISVMQGQVRALFDEVLENQFKETIWQRINEE